MNYCCYVVIVMCFLLKEFFFFFFIETNVWSCIEYHPFDGHDSHDRIET